ncbi:MAG: mitochondrial fission ELM1 family protein [Rhodospirillales bacterium]
MLQAQGRPLCWAVSDNKAGNRIQAQGLAEALGLQPRVTLIPPRPPWSWLPPQLCPDRLALRAALPGQRLQPPWPDLAIGVGRNAVLPLLAIRAASQRLRPEQPTFIIQVQRPTLPAERFDLVVVPRHDGLSGDNVIAILGSIHRVTEARLRAARTALAPRLADLPRRRIAVLLGGRSKVHRFEASQARLLGRQLAALADTENAALLITPSRRSDPAVTAILLAQLEAVPHFAWDGQGDNPYYGILASSEAAVVTADSVNMVSEAAAAGLPVLVVALEGGSAKFERFHDEMRAASLTRPFEGRLDLWRPPPFDEMSPLAEAVAARLPFAIASEQAS